MRQLHAAEGYVVPYGVKVIEIGIDIHVCAPSDEAQTFARSCRFHPILGSEELTDSSFENGGTSQHCCTNTKYPSHDGRPAGRRLTGASLASERRHGSQPATTDATGSGVEALGFEGGRLCSSAGAQAPTPGKFRSSGRTPREMTVTRIGSGSPEFSFVLLGEWLMATIESVRT